MGSRLLWIVFILLGLGALIWLLRGRIAFSPQRFLEQIRQISALHVLAGLMAIYVGFVLRATRWSLLLDPIRKTTTRELMPSQFIGFTAVALFGRVADLTRPYLVARRADTPVTSQLAIYSIERAFDLASAAILFSVTLAFAPKNMPHHEAFTRAGLISLAATVFLATLACLIRFTGARIAGLAASLLRPVSAKLSEAVRARILELREGFQTIGSFAQFAAVLGVSLVIWIGIALAYLESARAFRATPELAGMTFTGIMLLLATSLGASLLQLPVIGWFTQIAVIAAAYRGFYGVPVETASACGTVTLLVTSLSIIPGGLIASRAAGIGLREASQSAKSGDPESAS